MGTSKGNIYYIVREQGQYLDIAQEGGFFDLHFDLYDAAKETCNYIGRVCNFYLWYGVLYSNNH